MVLLCLIGRFPPLYSFIAHCAYNAHYSPLCLWCPLCLYCALYSAFSAHFCNLYIYVFTVLTYRIPYYTILYHIIPYYTILYVNITGNCIFHVHVYK